MLNDAICFKEVYIVCGYTDLRSGMGRLAALVEAQTRNRSYVPDTLYLFCGRHTDRNKGLVWEGDAGSCYIRGSQKAVSNGRAAPGSAFPDAAAVPLADGRADDHPEEVCQAGGAAGIYGMTLCKTEKFQGSPAALKAALPWQSAAGHMRFSCCPCGRERTPSPKRKAL